MASMKAGQGSTARRLWSARYSPAGVRIGLGCAIAAGVCITTLGSGTTGADTTFVPGTATAGAQAIALAPTTGGLNYAITLATSLSAYQNSQAQALSQTIDLGAIGTSLEAEGCNNSPPTIPKKDVPPPIQAESINGNQTLTDSITPQSTATGIGVGTESAIATTQPAGTATTTTAGIALPGGLIKVSGMTSSSHVAIVNGNTRTAVATSDVGQISIGNGALVLGGLHWSATETSGASTASAGTFSVGSITAAGVAVPLPTVPNPQSTLNILGTVLNAIGFNIQWPVQSTLPDGTVVISPLTIGIDNNVLGQEVIGANLGTVQPVREALVNAILNADCNLAAEITVSDIGVGVLAGGGNLNLSLGGANALTTDAAAVSPFTLGSSDAGSTAPIDTSLAPSDLSTGSGFTPGSVSLPTSTSTSTATSTPTGGATIALGPTTKTTACVSLGPAGGGCTTTNAAVPIGLAGLALVLGLAGWDYLRQRRRRQISGQEVLA